MVSKTIKKTPTRSIKDSHNHHHSRRHHRKKSPAKSATAAALIATINKSILTCQRRLVKLFSKLARIATPKTTTTTTHNRNKKGYKLLNKKDDTICRALVFDHHHDNNNNNNNKNLLPPLFPPHKRTVFLDLDETLVHSKADPPPKRFDFVVRPNIDGELVNFYVLKRPGLDSFLEALSAKFEVVVFTAGLRVYASLVLDRIDKKGLISHRLYRDSCREVDGKYVKDLGETGRELEKVVILDDNPNAYFLHPENAVPVKPFVDDMGDRELGRLMKFFEVCDCFEDMRDAVKHFVNVEEEGCNNNNNNKLATDNVI